MAKRRPSGDGMVRKREDGRWEGRIVVGHKENGDSIFRYVYAPTQKELSAKLRQHIDSYQGADLTEQSRISLGEWLNQWLKDIAGTIRPATLTRYQGTVENHIRPQLGSKIISQVTPRDIQRLYDKLAQSGNLRTGAGLSGGTIYGIHGMLHEALQAAQQAHLIASNPTEQVTVPKFTYGPKQILTEEQLEVFMSVIAEDEIWYDFFYAELTTGLRRGELCGLRWEDFDEVNGTLKICRTVYREDGGGLTTGDTKTSAGTRKIVLPSSTAALLSKRKASALTEWIFPNPLNPEQPANPNTAYSHLKFLLKRAGLLSIRFHDLRHTFATNALEHGMDIKTLSAVIGHVSSTTTLNVYAHVTDEMRQSAAAKIDRAIARVEPQPEPVVPKKPARTTFQAVKGKYRKPGTGCVTQISDRLWEGRYSPKVNGKRMARNIYAPTEAECEEKLAQLISQMKEEIADLRAQAKAG